MIESTYSLSRYKRPAVFLDRDGVLCAEKGYVTQIKELDLFPFAKRCIDLLHQKGFLAICITNQSAVARGMMSELVLQEMNQYLLRELSLDALYYCPHHPQGILLETVQWVAHAADLFLA